MRRTSAVVATTFILLFIPLASVFAVVGVRDYLPSRPAPALLPMDSSLGRLVDVSSNPLLERCAEAFSKPWSVQWVSTYVEPSVRSMFTHTWDKVMVDLLPVPHMVGSAPVGDESARTVAVRFFSPQAGVSSAYSLIWRLADDGQWYLIAMNTLR
jgi:hypothetical protein